jgi:hypothetical protein
MYEMNNLTKEKAEKLIAKARSNNIPHDFYVDKENNGRYVVRVNITKKAWNQITSLR